MFAKAAYGFTICVMAFYGVLPVKAALVRHKVYACRDAADLKLPVSFAAGKIASGACFALLPGAPVAIEGNRPGLFCVRPSGALDCLWVLAQSIDQYGQIPKPTARLPGNPTVFPLIGHPTDPFYHP